MFTVPIILMIIIFVVGYILIACEHITHINKTSIALFIGIVCWVLQFENNAMTSKENLIFLGEHLSDISQVIFFLLGALIIVEIINVHRGFHFISENIRFRSKRKLLWFVCILTFFLSAILDNLTTTIIMVTLAQKLMKEKKDRLILGGAIVIAANAGGAWTPIGDVTTTMLWIGGQISTMAVMQTLLMPSLVSLIVSLACLHSALNGNVKLENNSIQKEEKVDRFGICIFFLGLGALVFVPIFKVWTGLPPFMGIIFGLSIMWLVTDLFHRKDVNKVHLRVPSVIMRIDIASVLFFLGILLCIDALQTSGLLNALGAWMNQKIANSSLIAVTIGLASAIVDNVPLVAATMGMYDYPIDHNFWHLIAYCAGTGGSILVIGSAAGVAFMGLEKVEFFWYFRRIGIPALAGYLVGVGFFELARFI